MRSIGQLLRDRTQAEAERDEARKQERQRVREALKEQAAEYRREANEAETRGEHGGSERLLRAANVVDAVTRIALDTLEDDDE